MRDYTYKTIASTASTQKSTISMKSCETKFNKVYQDLVLTRKYEICPNGCYMYDSIDDRDKINCPHCKSSRTSKKYLQMVNFRDKIARLIGNKETRTMIDEYAAEVEAEQSQTGAHVYTDLFSGSVYDDLHNKGIVKDKYQLKFMLQIDGFSKSKSAKGSSFVIVHCLCLSIHPSMR